MKFFFDQSCSPLDAEHRYVCGLVKWLFLSELLTLEYWRSLAPLKPSMMHMEPWQEDKNPPNILALSKYGAILGPNTFC